MTNIKNSRRIFKNTMFLYFRMILILLVTLYTSRIILNTLGVEDFGIYSVVGGVVTMMAFLSGAMSSATQRFLSYELGRNDSLQFHNVFRMSINIHLLIIIIVLLIAETLGVWFVNNQLIIPSDRLAAANIVFHCAIFSFACSVISVPYSAAIISCEKMSAFAYISIADVILKLIMVLLLTYYGEDKLKVYAVLLSFTSLISLFCYYVYARLRLYGTRFNLYWDNILFRRLFSYTGWNLFGNLAAVASNQGVNILLNMFFGAPVNAARAIAFQVNSAISGFVYSLQTAINPQIVKSYANNNHQYMMGLVFSGARYSFYLLFMIATPLLLQTESILVMWLGGVPQYASDFCRLIIIDSLIISLSGTLMMAFQATGKIKIYQMVVGSIILCNLPLSYVFLSYGFDARVTMVIGVCISVLALFARVFLLSNMFKNIVSSFIQLICRVAFVFVPTILISSCFSISGTNKLMGLAVSCLSYWGVALFSIFLVGLNQKERHFLMSKFKIVLKNRLLVGGK